MRTLIWSLACCLSVLIAPAAMAQDRGTRDRVHSQGRRHSGPALSRDDRH